MSSNRTIEQQENEIAIAITQRAENSTTLQENINRSEIETAKKETAVSTKVQNNNQEAVAIAKLIKSSTELVKKMWENYEDGWREFSKTVKRTGKTLWEKFKELGPLQKVLAVLCVLGMALAIAVLGYFSWQFIHFFWVKIMAFITPYAVKIGEKGGQLVTSVQNSEAYKNFGISLEKNLDKIDIGSAEGLVLLGLPSMLTMYKAFFDYLATPNA